LTGWINISTDDRAFESSMGPHLCRGNSLGGILKDIREGVKPKCDSVAVGFSRRLQACKRFARYTEYEQQMSVEDLPTVVFMRKPQFMEDNPSAVEVEYADEWLRNHPDILEALMTGCPDSRPLDDKVFSAKVHQDEQEVVVVGSPGKISVKDIEINVYTEVDHLRRMGMFEHRSIYEIGIKDVVSDMAEFTGRIKALVEKEIGGLVNSDDFLKVSVHLCQDTMNLMDEKSSKCALYDKFYLEGKK